MDFDQLSPDWLLSLSVDQLKMRLNDTDWDEYVLQRHSLPESFVKNVILRGFKGFTKDFYHQLRPDQF